MDIIVKLYAEELVKKALAKQGIKLSHIKRTEFNAAVKDIADKTPNIREKAYKHYNK